jgi:FAD/FMN-containing dehydrogenase
MGPSVGGMKAMTEQMTDLAARTRGPVYRPGDDGYDEERTGYQLLDPHRPQVIVAAAGAQDVRTAVEYAAEHRIPLAVQATGHGLRAATEGVLISTRRMTEVTVDPSARTAWVAAGATWAHVIAAAAPHGLAPLSGSFPGVGAVSYTLGGGLGLLARPLRLRRRPRAQHRPGHAGRPARPRDASIRT